jgi:predicted PurR-regulated permease PerM
VLLLCTLMVILPLLFIGMSLAQEGAAFYQKVDSGEINLRAYVERSRDAFPPLQRLLNRLGVDMGNLNQQITDAAVQASRYMATQALSIGQNTAQFLVSLILMLYLTFFLLRDGEQILQLSIRALPFGDARERMVLGKLSEVISATVKGNLVVASIQGGLGGFIFWVLGVQGALLWAVVMAVASLLPSVGSALIWAPVALYFLFTGAIWQGAVLIAFGAGVIGLVDNVLRPILVGRTTRIPDYLVLLSTLGGIAIFGLNGFVVGPLIAALFIAFWDIFVREFNP